METVQLTERAGEYKVLFAVDNTAATPVVPIPQYAHPFVDGSGFFSIQADAGGATPLRVEVLPTIVGASSNTALMNVYGWSKMSKPNTAAGRELWVPKFLASFTLTAGTVAGLGDTQADATHLFAGTIVIAKGGVAGLEYGIASPTGNDIGSFWVAIRGSSIIQVTTGLNSSSTSVNGLIKTI